MLIIPAIDILGGKVVRLRQGDYSAKTVYSADPIKLARQFEAQGADRLHIVDLDGARTGRPLNQALILRIREAVSIPIEVGGGIRDVKTAQTYLKAGIDRIILGTAAIPLIKKLGAARVIAGLDLHGTKVATQGWTKTTRNYLDYARELKRLGVTEVICTDIARDGMLGKPNLKPILKLKKLGFQVIASGGVSDTESLRQLQAAGIRGAIIGKALYEKKLSLALALAAVRPPSGLAKRIIPCLDIKNGRVVKGVGFKNLRDAGDPVALGRYYSEQGADELVFLDITATVEKRRTLVELVRRIAREINIPFCVGGGIQSIADIKALLEAGADKISLGTAAVKNPGLVTRAARRFGSQCIVISIDAKRAKNQWLLTIRGGRELTELDAIEFAGDMERRGAGELLVNSLDRDGTKKGYDLELLRAISSRVRIPVIASSGAGKMKDFLEALTLGRADAALAASLFHYGKVKIPTLKRYLARNQIGIRPCVSSSRRRGSGDDLDFQKLGGLIPVIIQNAQTQQTLMLGFMNREAYEKTRQTGFVWFYSRTRQRLWKKGEESGNALKVLKILPDCDRDTLLIKAIPTGPTCHTGEPSCFGDEGDALTELFEVIRERKKTLPKNSYTASLFRAGLPHISAKVLEESVEVIHAAKKETKQRVIEEAADLLYHLLVLLAEKNLTLKNVRMELQKRSVKM